MAEPIVTVKDYYISENEYTRYSYAHYSPTVYIMQATEYRPKFRFSHTAKLLIEPKTMIALNARTIEAAIKEVARRGLVEQESQST
jgi:hypothetical protein